MPTGVAASDIDLNCYRIDPLAIVIKYVGETEKNLWEVFKVAEDRGVILLFDEADALFASTTGLG
jgi:SpoVK/Ycf46/Vps4 family AAA+-type ATPase